MANDRPLFDDEELPAWMKNAGITSGGGETEPSTGQPAADDSDLSWLNELPQEPSAASTGGATPWANQPTEGSAPWAQDIGATQPEASGDMPPWMQGDASAEPAASTPVDQDDMPPWMQGAAPEEPATAQQSADSDLPPWMQPSTAQQGEPAASGGDLSIDWGNPGGATPETPKSGASVTGMLPWRQDASDEEQPGQPAAAASGLPWEQPAASEPAQPASEPDWIQQFPSRNDLPEEMQSLTPPAAEPPAGGIKRIKPLGQSAQPPQPAQPSQPTPPADDLSWLDEAIQQAPSAPETPEQPTPIPQLKPLPSKPAEPPAIKPLSAAKPTPPPAEQPRPSIKRLPQRPPEQQPTPAVPDMSNMTYEEWELAQIAKEQEAQSDPNDKLLDEVPEWFTSGDQPSAAPSAPTGGVDLMPEWYVGMEEQSHDAAPDWFSSVDLSSTSLVGPETVQKPPVPELPSTGPATPTPSPADEVPDWFKDTGVGDLDFNAMFVSQETPEEPQPASRLSAKLAGLTPEPPSAPEPAAPEPVAVEPPAPEPMHVAQEEASAEPEPEPLDWMADMPDLGDLPTLEGEPEPVQEIPAEPVSADSPDLLDWMSEEPAAPAEASVVEPDLIEADVPAWMQEMTPADAAPMEPVEPDLIEGDVPAWMQEMAPADAKPAASASPEETPVEASDVPEWLRDMSPVQPEPAAPAPVPADESQPDWLNNLSFPDSDAVEVPDWASSQPAPEPGRSEAAPASSDMFTLDANQSVDIDALLGSAPLAGDLIVSQPDSRSVAPIDTDFDLDAVLGPVSEPTVQPEPETIDLDGLGSELSTTVEEMPVEEPPRAGRLQRITPAGQGAAAPEAPKAREDLPEWLSDMRPSEAPIPLHIGDQEVRLQDRPLAQVPDPIRRLRDRTKAVREQTPSSEAPSAGPLAGITGVIEGVPGVIKPVPSIAGAVPAISDLDAKRIKILQNILGLEEEMLQQRAAAEDVEAEAKPKAKARAQSSIKFDRFVITVLLFLAVLAPFFTPLFNVTPPLDAAMTPAQTNVVNAINGIQADSLVLVAFEYGPTGAGELDDLARAVLRDLLRQKARPVIVSTNPSGAMHAQSLMATLSRSKDDLAYLGRPDKPLMASQDYYVLRYLPGGAAGVHALANAVLTGGFDQTIVFGTDIEGRNLLQTEGAAPDPTKLDALHIGALQTTPAFILTESPDDVRNWVEQYRATGKPISMVLLSSSAASAVAQTYATGKSNADKHIIGPLVGLRDSMVYQVARNQLPTANVTRQAQRWQSVGLALLLATVVILLGTAINLMRRMQRRARR